MIIDVDDIQSRRFQVGLSCLREGGGMRLGRVELVCPDNRTIECCTITEWEPSLIDDKIARADLEIARRSYDEIRAASDEFRHFAQRCSVRYSVIYDYGKGSVEVCRLEGDEIVWSDRQDRPPNLKS
jgi:hypothetical protein